MGDIRIGDIVQIEGTRTGLFDVPDVEGFKVEIAHATKAMIQMVYKRNTKLVYSSQARQRVEKIDTAAVANELSFMTIKGWSGLTVGGLKRLVILKDTGLKDTDVVNFSVENGKYLWQSAAGFDMWVIDIATDPAQFQTIDPKDHEDAVGNLSGTESGS